MKNRICVGSRESRLAVVQSQTVVDFIQEHHPETEVSMLTMKTTGDRVLDRTLDQIGGKGLFVKELDQALLDGRSDLSVHSLKDLPMEVSEELPLLAFSKREDPRDVLVLPEGTQEWDRTLPVGCASRRRMLQLQELFPGIQFQTVRGNLQTRLRKLDEGQYGALILAAAGLKRLGMENRISRYFSTDEVIPAAGQAVLAVQGRRGEDYACLDGYNDQEAETAILCERAFVRTLDGGCTSPAAAYAQLQGDELVLSGLYYEEASGCYCRGMMRGLASEPEKLGKELAEKLRGECHPGTVWLVGAGPGDPGLLTLRAKEILEKAEVVVFDALVGQGILSMIPAGAKLINVGKRSNHHIMRQEEINRVLLHEAQAGKRVVRLKGGDPFLFGRGGEELELLEANHIPFEIIPGITSALAVPAYNGIPVTHRDYCSSVHIITGHKRQGQEYDIDFQALVKTKGTLVFLMGIAALESICRGLLDAGMDPEMPAAVLQKGTTAGQKRIVADLATLAEEVRRCGVETPAIIVVGRVCSLADRFCWHEKKPLSGKKILVTRPRELSSEMAGKLRDKGAEVLELPAIRTAAIEPNPDLEICIRRGEAYDWIVFTSPTGVRIFFEQLKKLLPKTGCDIRRFAGAKFAVIGAGTARALLAYGISADLVPETTYDGRSLGCALAKACRKGERVLIPRAALGTRELTDALSETEGLIIEDISLYDTFYEKSAVISEKAEFENGTIDYAVFTSASTVKGFAEAVGDIDYRKVNAVCIGKQTRAAADALGMNTWMSEKASMDSIIELLEEIAGQQI